MATLEELTVGASVRGLAADGPATVVSVNYDLVELLARSDAPS